MEGTTDKKPRSQAQIDATNKMIAANAAKRAGGSPDLSAELKADLQAFEEGGERNEKVWLDIAALNDREQVNDLFHSLEAAEVELLHRAIQSNPWTTERFEPIKEKNELIF